jgi:HPt (histidine-containing phosphotransfer) domain-containing protein
MDEKPMKEPMNIDVLMDQFDGDREFIKKFIRTFLTNAWKQLGKIKSAVTGEDFDMLAEEAHALKGGAGYITAEFISKLALELEKMGRSRSLEVETEKGSEVIVKLEKEIIKLDLYFASLRSLHD